MITTNIFAPHTGQVFDTPRKILQYIGTEVLHPIDPLISCEYYPEEDRPKCNQFNHRSTIPQEFDALYGRPDFLPVHVNNTKAELAAEADSHASEKGGKSLKDRCLTLDNNTDIANLTKIYKL